DTEISFEEDDVFEEALSELSEPVPEPAPATPGQGSKADEPDLSSAEDMDAELDFLADADEAATKLDLARAYIDMGDTEGAKDILAEVSQEGNDEQKREAEELLTRID